MAAFMLKEMIVQSNVSLHVNRNDRAV